MIAISENEKVIINELNHPLYTVEFLEKWINRDDNPMINAVAALQAMSAKGYYEAVKLLAAQRTDISQEEQQARNNYEKACAKYDEVIEEAATRYDIAPHNEEPS